MEGKTCCTKLTKAIWFVVFAKNNWLLRPLSLTEGGGKAEGESIEKLQGIQLKEEEL